MTEHFTPDAQPIDPDQLHFSTHSFSGLRPGPKLMVTGAVHGNEVCGPIAINRVLDDIAAGRLRIAAGTVTFVPTVNPLAYAKRMRVGDRNLNRNLFPTEQPAEFEDHIANWLCPLLSAHDVLLDCHSTHANNPAFAMIGPRNNSGALQPFVFEAAERAMAKILGVNRFVDGWLDTYATGTVRRAARLAAGGVGGADARKAQLNTDARYGVGTTEYTRSVGGYAITLECGSHNDPQSPEVAYRAIRNTLAHLGISTDPAPQPVQTYEYLSMVDVIDRLDASDTFSRAWGSFDHFKQGELIATRATGEEVRAPFDGRILFPDANALPGNEWFYVTRQQVAL